MTAAAATTDSLREAMAAPLEDDRRRYPPVKVGDTFGSRRVEKILPRDATSNERVLAKCLNCDHEAPAYVFNLRAAAKRKSGRCQFCPKSSGKRGRASPKYVRERAAQRAANLWRASRDEGRRPE